MIIDAMYTEKCNEKIHCKLCPHNCVIGDDNYGLCSVRTNIDGVLKTINYGEITSIGKDPIEKKPLYHFKPGKDILSIGSFGCNFTCGFCQNFSISQYKAKSKCVSPEDIVDVLESTEDNIGIAFTYNEPSIWYEYVYNTSKLIKAKSPETKVVLVSNGYIQGEPLRELLPYVDAMNIDLKAFTEKYYKGICGGRLEPVLENIKIANDKCHVEITTLLVSNENDSEEEVEKIASFLGDINKDIPLHLSRYFPNYKMDNPPTEVDQMIKDKEVASKYLNYVYLGNLAGSDTSTYCPQCNRLLINRSGYHTEVKIMTPHCPACGYKINVVL